MIIVAEITVAIDDAGTEQTFLFSSVGWTTTPTDTPANTHVQPRLMQPANYRRELFSGNRTLGAVRAAFGECLLANADGGLDDMIRYGFDGRRFILRAGEKDAAYPDDFTTLMICTMSVPWFELTETSGAVHIKLTDDTTKLDKPISPGFFAGTGGLEGDTAASGMRKPVLFGSVFHCDPQIINESLKIYSAGFPPAGLAAIPFYAADGQGPGLQWCDSSGNNNPPSYGVDIDCADYAELAGADVPAGNYAVCSSLGLIRVGTLPVYGLACGLKISDISTWSDTDHTLPGTMINDIVTAAGITNINTDDIAALDAARPSGYGVLVTGDESATDIIAKIANSCSAWFGFDRLGQFRVGIFDAPAGDPVHIFSQHNIKKLQRLDNQSDAGVPIWSVIARCGHNDFPQNNLVPSFPAWAKSWYQDEWPKQVVASDATVKVKHANADDLTIDVYTSPGGGSATDAGEAARRLALYGVAREAIMITAALDIRALVTVDLGAVVMLRYPRFGWHTGKLFKIVAVSLNFDLLEAEYTLWG